MRDDWAGLCNSPLDIKMRSVSRWGDLPIIRDTESGIAAIEREQMTKPRPLDVEGPALYQPSADFVPSTGSSEAAKEELDLDPWTTHTIRLLKYSHQLTVLIDDARLQMEQKSGDTSCLVASSPPPPLPPWQPPKKKHQFLRPFLFIPEHSESLFAQGLSRMQPSAFDATTCKQLLKRSVAAICAHAGFDSCKQSVLDTLTDVCEDHMRQMLLLLRAASDGERYHGGCGFPDAITRVFYEMGIGSLSSIYDFHQNRVVAYHDRLLQKCTELRDEYERLRKPRTAPVCTDDGAYNKNAGGDQSSVIQFPATEEADDAAVAAVTGDAEHLDHLESMSLDMSIGQESSGTTEEEIGTKWKVEAASASKHEPEERLSESCVQGNQTTDAFRLAAHLQPDSKRTNVTGNVTLPLTTGGSSGGGFLLKPPLKKFKK